MEAVAKELESGKSLAMCGFCEAYGKLMTAGAKAKDVDGEFTSVSMVTSDDPEVIKQIHQVADRCIKEQKAMHEQHAAKPAKSTSK
jgi:hypothetical protein